MAQRKSTAGKPSKRYPPIGSAYWSIDGPCAFCGVREGRGFYFCKDLFHGVYPEYTFCSMECMAAGSAMAGENGVMPKLTDMELVAIRETRPVFYDTLVLLKKEKLFDNWRVEEIDAVIMACAEGVRRSMQKQSHLDPNKPPF